MELFFAPSSTFAYMECMYYFLLKPVRTKICTTVSSIDARYLNNVNSCRQRWSKNIHNHILYGNVKKINIHEIFKMDRVVCRWSRGSLTFRFHNLKWSSINQAFQFMESELVITDLNSKVHGANMGPTWVLSVPDGPHVCPKNLAIRGAFIYGATYLYQPLDTCYICGSSCVSCAIMPMAVLSTGPTWR